MAGELGYLSAGFPISLTFMLPNMGIGATTVMTGAQVTPGYKVPTGYKFIPMLIAVSVSGELTGGTCIAKVTADGTAVVNGPEATVALATPKQHATAVVRAGKPAPIAAGSVVGAVLVTDAQYLANTLDYDVTVAGVLLPA